MKLMAYGMFKKVVIADRISEMIGPVFSQPKNYSGVGLVSATIFFAYEIYCDFSGYCDMALGLARMLGIELPWNFNRPYRATSPAEWLAACSPLRTSHSMNRWNPK